MSPDTEALVEAAGMADVSKDPEVAQSMINRSIRELDRRAGPKGTVYVSARVRWICFYREATA
jgi:hypothetical protein